jgi:hypothetical protein
MDFDQQSVGATRDCGLGHRHDHIPVTGPVAWVGYDGQV